MRLEPRLLDAATRRYRPAGRFAYHFARGKLLRDPVFAVILQNNWIAPESHVLDLGCGQGLLASLLLAADRGSRVRGIELMPREAQRARIALGEAAEIVCEDIRQAAFGQPDVAVILDVLHYIAPADQELVLQRLRRALAPGGLLLLRVGDAAAGLPFRLSTWVDRAVVLVRRRRLDRLHCRTLAEWRGLLERLDFHVRVVPLRHGVPFANILLECRLPDS